LLHPSSAATLSGFVRGRPEVLGTRIFVSAVSAADLDK
jgi:hypothetical protein